MFKSRREEIRHYAQDGITLDEMCQLVDMKRTDVCNELNRQTRLGNMHMRIVDGKKVYTTIPEEIRVKPEDKSKFAEAVEKIKISADRKNNEATITNGAPKEKPVEKKAKPEPKAAAPAQPLVQPGSLCMGADKVWDLKVTMPDTTVDALMLASQHLKAAGHVEQAKIVRKVAAIMELTHI